MPVLKTWSVIADSVTFQLEEGGELAGALFQNAASLSYLALSRWIAQGEEGVYTIERDDQAWTTQGGLVRGFVSKSSCSLEINDEASVIIGAKILTAKYNLTSVEFSDLLKVLGVIFQGSEGLLEVARGN